MPWPTRLLLQANRARKQLFDLPGLRAYGAVGSIEAASVRGSVEAAITISAPQTVRSSFPHATPAQLDYALVEKRAYLLRDVQVWSNQSVAMTRDGTIIRETAFSDARLQVALREHRFERYPVKRIRGLCTTLALGKWHNYYHFMIDLLPRLHALRHPEVRALGRVRILLAQRLRDAELALLRALLPEHVELEVLRWPVRLQAERYLWLPYLSGDSAAFLPDDYVSWFLEQAHPAHGTRGAGEAREAILISRRSARARRLSNESEIEARLAPLGFKTYVLEAMSLADQAALFRRASVIVAPHGAGLTNTIYSPTGCRVLELFAGEPTPHYRLLAQSRGHRYANLSAGLAHKDTDFSIDPQAVVAKLEALSSTA